MVANIQAKGFKESDLAKLEQSRLQSRRSDSVLKSYLGREEINITEIR